MRMNKQVILSLFAVAAAAMLAGCAPSTRPAEANAAGSNAAISSAGQSEAKPQDTPYSQPLMATGGDLVMLPVTSRGIAG
jgi:hypothetical protein